MKLLLACVLVLGLVEMSMAEETVAEKAQVKIKTVGRAGKKAVHRTQEAMCGKLTGDSKVKCLAKKAQNRAEEGVDAVKDKASEVKNAVDSDKK